MKELIIFPANMMLKDPYYKATVATVTDWTYTRSCLLGSLTYFLLASALVYPYFEEHDTGSQTYQNLYFRGTVNTTYFSPGGLLLYVCLHALGYTLVALVNC